MPWSRFPELQHGIQNLFLSFFIKGVNVYALFFISWYGVGAISQKSVGFKILFSSISYAFWRRLYVIHTEGMSLWGNHLYDMHYFAAKSICDLWQLLLGRKMAFLNVYQWVSHWWWKYICLYCLLQSYILLSYMAIIVYLSKTFVCKCFIYIDVNMSQSPDRNCPIYSLN